MSDHDQDDDTDPTKAALLREVRAVAANPIEEGVSRLMALASDPDIPAMVRVRASATLLEIGYGPAEEGEP